VFAAKDGFTWKAQRKPFVIVDPQQLRTYYQQMSLQLHNGEVSTLTSSVKRCMATIRLVQVGMGGWGRNWVSHVIHQSEDVELVACVDLNAGILAQAQQFLNLPPERCFLTVESALASVEADAVLITASLPAHIPLALQALNAGKHVLLEKPFAPTIAQAQQVVTTAAKRHRVLMISQNYRFFPAVRAGMILLLIMSAFVD
jgi:hypothetical protein